MTDKISIALYYDEKLDVEKEKNRWISLPGSVNFVNEVGKFLVKSHLIFPILTMEAYFSIVNLRTQLASSLNDRPTRLLYREILLLTNRPQMSSTGKIVISLFRTFFEFDNVVCNLC